MNSDVNNRNYQIYDKVSPEVEKLLALSLKNSEDEKLRNVNCPRCHLFLNKVSTNTVGFIITKCPKCKHEDVLDLRIFRTAKTKQDGPIVKQLPEFIPGRINLFRQDLF